MPIDGATTPHMSKCNGALPSKNAGWLVRLTFAATLALLQACGALPTSSVTSGLVACEGTSHHHDGDTFTCEPKEEAQFVVRVSSIDAPETGQAYWRVARARLRELTAPGSLVDCYKVDRYKRRVCRLKTKDGQDAADLILSDGLAWYSEEFAKEDSPADRERFRRLVAQARAAHRGLWAEPDPMPPKTCRQNRRAGLKCY